MMTTTRYVRSAWVGNLVVARHYRRRGIGERLMEHAIGQLEARGIPTFWLEVDLTGVNIYRPLGFVERFELPRFQKRAAHPASLSRTEPVESDRRIRGKDH